MPDLVTRVNMSAPSQEAHYIAQPQLAETHQPELIPNELTNDVAVAHNHENGVKEGASFEHAVKVCPYLIDLANKDPQRAKEEYLQDEKAARMIARGEAAEKADREDAQQKTVKVDNITNENVKVMDLKRYTEPIIEPAVNHGIEQSQQDYRLEEAVHNVASIRQMIEAEHTVIQKTENDVAQTLTDKKSVAKKLTPEDTANTTKTEPVPVYDFLVTDTINTALTVRRAHQNNKVSDIPDVFIPDKITDTELPKRIIINAPDVLQDIAAYIEESPIALDELIKDVIKTRITDTVTDTYEAIVSADKPEIDTTLFENYIVTNLPVESQINMTEFCITEPSEPLEDKLVQLSQLVATESVDSNPQILRAVELIHAICSDIEHFYKTEPLLGATELPSHIIEATYDLLNTLGYESPEKTLNEMLNRQNLEFLIQALKYIALLNNEDNRQEFLSTSKIVSYKRRESIIIRIGRSTLQLARNINVLVAHTPILLEA